MALASGPAGDVSAVVTVQGDDLEVVSNCPEWVTVRAVYEHLRWRGMPSWEQRAWLRADSRPRSSKPVWDGRGGLLTFGGKAWKFRVQSGPVGKLLGELQRLGWPTSVVLNFLGPEQVREAAMVLRKTRPDIQWSASTDGYLSWRVSHI